MFCFFVCVCYAQMSVGQRHYGPIRVFEERNDGIGQVFGAQVCTDTNRLLRLHASAVPAIRSGLPKGMCAHICHLTICRLLPAIVTRPIEQRSIDILLLSSFSHQIAPTESAPGVTRATSTKAIRPPLKCIQGYMLTRMQKSSRAAMTASLPRK